MIVPAIIGAMGVGALMPASAFPLAKILALLSYPIDDLAALEGKDYLENQIKLYSIVMAIAAAASFVLGFMYKASLGVMSENVTFGIRQLLYGKILEKHMGWFDERDNSPGILTSAMAKDTTILNGVGGESLGPVFEAMFALLTGLILAFIYSWK